MAVWLLPVLLLGVLGLAACGASTSTQAQATPTPSAAQILQHVSAVSIKDMAFTFSGTETAAGQSLNLSGSAKLTTTPARVQMQITLPYSGAQLSMQFIVDGATNTVYANFGANSLGLPTNVWYKGTATGTLGSFSSIASQLTSSTSFSGMTNATLVGPDTINGVAVWHLHGTTTGSSTPATGTTGTETVDAYFRQDNYYPVKGVITGNGLNLTINFTSVNTGLTITLPTNTTPLP